ncbi:vitamin B12 dependent-methionine synthase activation domain-containing protein [Amedibacillus sp. YH-ame10]
MELTLENLTNEEILHFIGNAKSKPDEQMMKEIEDMKQKVIALSMPRFMYREFAWENQQLIGAEVVLSGDDIKRLLKKSHHCLLLAVTLGISIEKEMRRLQLVDMGKALIFDCCANAAIEHVCDQLQQQLEIEYKKKGNYLTDRYSCGYGDLPITIQKDLLNVLETSKKIGLYVNESSVLHPMKSVTAIIGIADEPQPAMLRGCGYCSLRDRCEFRKGGTTCGSEN